MCKTIRNQFNKKLTFDSLLAAHERAQRGKTYKGEVLKFNIDLESNLINILNSLKNGSYKPGKYFCFIVNEPKERLIKALPYKDRIVQQWYIAEFIKPYIIPRFIKDTYACIEGRGTHEAVRTVQRYMRKMSRSNSDYYILKCDVRKFFYSIDKNILYSIMKKYISDRKLLNLTYKFIYDDEDKIGIPIGNYTSQFFANIYLNELDKYIKEELKVKYYVRYMDDFICLLKDKEESIYIKEKINNFLDKKLNLCLNHKSVYYPNKMGVNFCGYRIYETHKLLRNRSKKKIKKYVSIWNKLYSIDKLDEHKMLLCWNSWVAHSKHSNSYNFRIKMHSKIECNKLLKY